MKYDDIINLPHYVSEKHKQMSLEARSVQFAPFAALTGYSEAIRETARVTDKKIELDDDSKSIIDMKLHIILKKIDTKPEIKVLHFIKDKKKSGGAYQLNKGHVTKIDLYNSCLYLIDKKIYFDFSKWFFATQFAQFYLILR